MGPSTKRLRARNGTGGSSVCEGSGSSEPGVLERLKSKKLKEFAKEDLEKVFRGVKERGCGLKALSDRRAEGGVLRREKQGEDPAQ